MTNRDIIDEIVTGCAEELFALHGTVLRRATERIDPHEYVAVIGFHGDAMRGALGVGLDKRVVALMVARAGEDGERDVAVEDCIAEATNQLLGRVKNKLLDYGVALGVALPMVLRGIEVHLSPSSPDVQQYRFSCPEGGLSVWFDARIDAGVVLERRDDLELVGAREGELTMF